MSASAESRTEASTHGITIWLDSYDDIFSDFDSRGYSDRVFSDDFLNELRKLSREDDGQIESFHFLLPANVRKEETEKIISRRLHGFFKKNYERAGLDVKQTRRKGILFSALGLVLLLLAGFISFHRPAQIGLHLLMVTCEPAGWFLIWMGYDLFMNGVARKKTDLSFYTKILRSGIRFLSLEPDPKK